MLLRWLLRLRWWLEERRLPWCEDCQIRHYPPASPTVPGTASLHGGFGRRSASTSTREPGTTSQATATPAAFSSPWQLGTAWEAREQDLSRISPALRLWGSYAKPGLSGGGTAALGGNGEPLEPVGYTDSR